MSWPETVLYLWNLFAVGRKETKSVKLCTRLYADSQWLRMDIGECLPLGVEKFSRRFNIDTCVYKVRAIHSNFVAQSTKMHRNAVFPRKTSKINQSIEQFIRSLCRKTMLHMPQLLLASQSRPVRNEIRQPKRQTACY